MNSVRGRGFWLRADGGIGHVEDDVAVVILADQCRGAVTVVVRHAGVVDVVLREDVAAAEQAEHDGEDSDEPHDLPGHDLHLPCIDWTLTAAYFAGSLTVDLLTLHQGPLLSD